MLKGAYKDSKQLTGELGVFTGALVQSEGLYKME